jgi:hypothetical protein
VEKCGRKKYITERKGGSCWEWQGIVAFCTCQWNEWMNEWRLGFNCSHCTCWINVFSSIHSHIKMHQRTALKGYTNHITLTDSTLSTRTWYPWPQCSHAAPTGGPRGNVNLTWFGFSPYWWVTPRGCSVMVSQPVHWNTCANLLQRTERRKLNSHKIHLVHF